jgi:hypothetical protein
MHYGVSARKELERDGVGLSLALSSDKPTCTATVTLDSAGSASYEFLIDGTATFDFSFLATRPRAFKTKCFTHRNAGHDCGACINGFV